MNLDIFNEKTTWLFDLDNTLYPEKSGIFEQIDERMKIYISQKLKISKEKAFDLQKLFYKKYGTTLCGLMKHYDIDPEEFLEFVHDINFNNLKKSHKLKENLQLLPGKCIVYTNGDSDYASKILESLGIKPIFTDIFDIRKADYIPKPTKISFDMLLKKYSIIPERTVFFDDLEKNLVYAFQKGITTIHISDKKNVKKPYISFRFKTVINALDMIIKSME